MTPTLKFVVDPMCPWCWAMAPHIEATLKNFDGRVAFDLAVGGINIRTMKALRKSGLKRLQALWRRVTAVTGQQFSHRLPAEIIYNSQLPCLAVEAMRTLMRAPPFAYLHYLQRLLFVDGVNINNLDVVLEACDELGADPDRLVALMGPGRFCRHLDVVLEACDELGADPDRLVALMDREPVKERTRRQIHTARSYGTSALPSVLVSAGGAEFRLFAGGFMDAVQLEADIERWLAE